MIEALLTRLEPFLSLVGRALMAQLFLMAGLSQIGNVKGFAEGLAADGVPIIIGGLVFWFLLFSGFLLLIGAATRLVAVAMAGFSMVSGILAYADLGQSTDLLMLMKNIALTGGFLFVALHGPGAWSVDAHLQSARGESR